jgi:IMP dehydrogenase
MLPPFSDVDSNAINLDTTLVPGKITLRLPLVSSPMDTVTGWKTALHFALHGGIGIIHFNSTAEEQATQVRRVKRYRMGFIFSPVCRRPDQPISEVDAVKMEHGFSTVLITEDGTQSSRLLGMVTKGNVALAPDKTRKLGEVMIARKSLRTRLAADVRTLEKARDVLRSEPIISKLPLLNDDDSVYALITRDDVVKSGQYPLCLVDRNEQLMVGAAVSTQPQDCDRAKALLEAGADLLVVDSAQGGTHFACQRIREIRRLSPDVSIMAGNVVTPAQAMPLIEAGADALRVGMGSGSICITQDTLAIGRSQLSAIYHTSRAQLPVIADGGTRSTSDIVKALACGAAAVMVGRYIAGCDETLGDEERDSSGQRWKRYRGMGSPSAIREGGVKRYGCDGSQRQTVAQGVEGWVPSQGSLDRLLPETAATIRKALEYFGCETVTVLHGKIERGEICFELRSDASRKEGKPHDIAFAPFGSH